jgi:chromosome segregation ATPase
MFGTVTILLALLALAATGFAIVWLSKVNKQLADLGRRVLESEDIGRIYEAADRTQTFESRLAGCERKAAEGQNQLAEFKTQLSELASRTGSVEQLAKKNEACIDEIIPNIKALADEIQIIKRFQMATERVHSLILAAFNDMQASMTNEEGFRAPAEVAKPQEASDPPEEWWQVRDDKTAINN